MEFCFYHISPFVDDDCGPVHLIIAGLKSEIVLVSTFRLTLTPSSGAKFTKHWQEVQTNNYVTIFTKLKLQPRCPIVHPNLDIDQNTHAERLCICWGLGGSYRFTTFIKGWPALNELWRFDGSKGGRSGRLIIIVHCKLDLTGKKSIGSDFRVFGSKHWRVFTIRNWGLWLRLLMLLGNVVALAAQKQFAF